VVGPACRPYFAGAAPNWRHDVKREAAGYRGHLQPDLLCEARRGAGVGRSGRRLSFRSGPPPRAAKGFLLGRIRQGSDEYQITSHIDAKVRHGPNAPWRTAREGNARPRDCVATALTSPTCADGSRYEAMPGVYWPFGKSVPLPHSLRVWDRGTRSRSLALRGDQARSIRTKRVTNCDLSGSGLASASTPPGRLS
jgi:hypothetical protein